MRYELGQKILYVYCHHLNHFSSVMRGKNAIFLTYLSNDSALIYVIGNKTATKTGIDSLQEQEEELMKK